MDLLSLEAEMKVGDCLATSGRAGSPSLACAEAVPVLSAER